MTSIYIILPVNNRKKVTEDFIKSLKDQSYKNYYLVLIDDGSTDGTAARVSELIPGAIILRGNGSLWWAGSVQKGISWLKHKEINTDDIILLINDDTRMPPVFLERAISILKKSEKTLLLAQSLDIVTGEPKETGLVADYSSLKFSIATSQEKINCLSGRGLFLRYGDLIDIGNFHPKLLPHYGADYEYTIRAHKKGYKLMTSPLVFLRSTIPASSIRNTYLLNEGNMFINVFSKKSHINPIYLTTLIFMVADKKRIPFILLRVWGRIVVIWFKYVCFGHDKK